MTHIDGELKVARLIAASDEELQGIHREPVIFPHRLCELAMLDDDHLAMLIERAGAAGPMHYNLALVERDEEGREVWVQGLLTECRDVDGKRVLDMIKEGRLWLQIEHLNILAPHLYGLLVRAYQELEERLPGFSWRNLYTNLLISGPNAVVTPHIDVAEVILFHIRGHKRMRLWDPAVYPVPEKIQEGIILREQYEDFTLPEEWKDGGVAHDLGPGMGVSFPYLWPHSVENLGDFNVSLQTEYHHPATIRRYGALYANGVLRRHLGLKPAGTGPGALGETLRAAAGLVAKKLKIRAPKPRRVTMAFVVDPQAPGHVRRIPEDKAIVLTK
jgi:hypothetical protein